MSEELEVYKLGKNLPKVSENELYNALKIYNEYEDFDAEYTIVSYILDEFSKAGKKTTSCKEINERLTELVVNHALESLSKKGLVDVIFEEGKEIQYKLSEAGHEYMDKLF